MDIKYEMEICDKCNEEEKITKRVNELRKKLYYILKKKHNDWVEENEENDIINKDIELFKKEFHKKCIIFYNDEGEMNLCEKHFKELLKGFE